MVFPRKCTFSLLFLYPEDKGPGEEGRGGERRGGENSANTIDRIQDILQHNNFTIHDIPCYWRSISVVHLPLFHSSIFSGILITKLLYVHVMYLQITNI